MGSGRASRGFGEALRGRLVVELGAELGKFLAGAALDEQRYKIPNGSTVEASVISVDYLCDGVRRQARVRVL